MPPHSSCMTLRDAGLVRSAVVERREPARRLAHECWAKVSLNNAPVSPGQVITPLPARQRSFDALRGPEQNGLEVGQRVQALGAKRTNAEWVRADWWPAPRLTG